MVSMVTVVAFLMQLDNVEQINTCNSVLLLDQNKNLELKKFKKFKKLKKLKLNGITLYPSVLEEISW